MAAAVAGWELGRRISGLRQYRHIGRGLSVFRRERLLLHYHISWVHFVWDSCVDWTWTGIPRTSAVQSSCKALQCLFVRLDAEREREKLVCNVHDCLARKARRMLGQWKNR